MATFVSENFADRHQITASTRESDRADYAFLREVLGVSVILAPMTQFAGSQVPVAHENGIHPANPEPLSVQPTEIRRSIAHQPKVDQSLPPSADSQDSGFTPPHVILVSPGPMDQTKIRLQQAVQGLGLSCQWGSLNDAGSEHWVFGDRLPSLEAMQRDPQVKKQAWQKMQQMAKQTLVLNPR